MKRFDMHIHNSSLKPDPAKFITELEKSGFYGGCIFSEIPLEASPDHGMSYEDRMRLVFEWTKGYEDRIFPVLWMHPYEENAFERVEDAVKRGIAGFKFILHDCYANEERCLKLFAHIASFDKPIFFHSGILWSSNLQEVSMYNRPAYWESLLRIPGIRFSLGHCSWPWVDECIALYGRIDDAKKKFIAKGQKPVEMFFDLTPGTPDNYREDLLTKLVEVDMDNVNNIMFGCDQWAERYTSTRLSYIYEMDRKIFDKLGVSVEARKRIYHDNLMRFLGKTTETPVRIPYHNAEVKDICRKWYKKLGFPIEYNNDFEQLLREYNISDAITIEGYNLNERDGRRNLLSMLFMCDEVERKYKEMGIDEKILVDTLSDIRLWTDAWTDVKGELCLYELPWLVTHMKCELFRIGSLEYRAGKAEFDCKAEGISKGDNIVEIHIPNGADLSPEAVAKSLADAKAFYEKHFPQYKFTHFTFHSWIMDRELTKLLKPESNLLKFQNMFTRGEDCTEEDYAALRYVFRWNTTRMNVRHEYACSSFAENLKKHVLSGGKLYVAGGVLKK